MARRTDEMVAERSKDPVVGCNDESRLLSGPLEPDGRIVALVHEIAGIGKTTLVRAFAERARLTGACRDRWSEHRADDGGFRGEVAAATGVDRHSAQATIETGSRRFVAPL